MSAVIGRDGSISLTWKDENDAWTVGDVLFTYGRDHNDHGFKDDGMALMNAADEVARRKSERLEEPGIRIVVSEAK